MSSHLSRTRALQTGVRLSCVLALALALLGLLAQAASAAPTRPTSTLITCPLEPVVVGETVGCVATVEDSAEPPTIPKGTVEFKSNGPGVFKDVETSAPTNTCTLKVLTGGSSKCPIKYTVSAFGSGSHAITAEYDGDATHKTSADQTGIEIKHPTITQIFCLPPIARTKPTTCDVLVTDQAFPNKTTPTGGLSFMAGSMSKNETCTLTEFISELGPVPGVGACTFTYVPKPLGEEKQVEPVNASYFGGPHHVMSSGESSVTILGVSHTSVSCDPSPQVALGKVTACKITVKGQLGMPPEVSLVTLTSDQAGSFPDGHNTCPLVQVGSDTAACTVHYKPEVIGNPTLTAHFDPDKNLERSEGATSLQVIREATTSLSCTPSDLAPGAITSCKAVVEDPIGGPPAEALPTGQVNFSSSGQGTFEPVPSCSLDPVAGEPSKASCTVTYSPAQASGHDITANYGGDANHLPSQGSTSLTVHRPTVTVVSCDPAKVDTGVTTACSARVVDLSPASVHPQGTVEFSNQGLGAFEGAGSCTLTEGANGNESRCSVNYTPDQVGSGKHEIGAAYSGAPGTDPSQGSTTVQVGNPTGTSVACKPAVAASGATTTCTATVLDESPQFKPLSGSVAFGHSGAGEFGSNGTCSLSDDGEGHASCSVQYTPQATEPGTQQLTATYGGDPSHAGSEGATSIEVLLAKDTTDTTVKCGPGALDVGATTHCVATLADTSAGAGGPPSGPISFSSDSPGDFSLPSLAAPSCELSEDEEGNFSCSMDYTPTGIASGIHKVTATYAGDAAHAGSAGQATVTITVPQGTPNETSAQVGCQPVPVALSHRTFCTVTVEDTSNSPSTPGGEVSFANDGDGSFPAGDHCAVQDDGTGPASSPMASCQVPYEPTGPGTAPRTISVAYGGDPDHGISVGSTVVEVTTEHPTSTALVCAPAPVEVGKPTHCTATVEDNAPAGRQAPEGAVTFQSDRAGSFSPEECEVSPVADAGTGSCEVDYVPAENGTQHLEAAYGGDGVHGSSAGSLSLRVGAVRFAAPDGTADGTAEEPCELANPCSLFAAASKSSPQTSLVAGDEVVVLPGAYLDTEGDLGPQGEILMRNDVILHGQFGLPRPVITNTVHGPFAVLVVGSADTASHLEIKNDGSFLGLSVQNGGVVDDVIVRSGFQPGTACSVSEGIVRDSVCVSTERGGSAVGFSGSGSGSVTVSLRNVTAVASGPLSTGVSAIAFGGLDLEVDALGVIAEGTKADVAAKALSEAPHLPGAGADVKVTLSHSDYQTIEAGTDAGEGSAEVTPVGADPTNITEEPAFTSDGYHELRSSPTVDRGALDELSGATDIDGQERTLGAAPDIGADEVVPLADTRTELHCDTLSVPLGGSTSCTATVEDRAVAAKASPGGTVSFADADESGAFSPASCKLEATGTGISGCEAEVELTLTLAGPHHLEAAYPGDADHRSSKDERIATAVSPFPHDTSTVVICEPANVTLGGATACTATVRDTAKGGPTVPGGEVSFESNGSGAFEGDGSCQLFPAGDDRSHCQVVYVPSQIGSNPTHSIDAAYGGEADHTQSSGSTQLTISPPGGHHATATTLDCEPSGVILGGISVCTATVEDTAGVHPSAPTGGVVFATGGAGEFSSATCALFPVGQDKARCQVTYKPVGAGPSPHEVTAIFPGDGGHEPSFGEDQVLVSAANGGHHTEAEIACQPSTLIVGEASTCIATVTDTDGNNTPTGGVVFASDSAGGFGSGGCHLTQATPGKASCQLTYTPAKTGQHKISAAYEGDPGSGGGVAHEPSPAVSTTLTANPAPPNDPQTPPGKGAPSVPPSAPAPGAAPNTILKKKPRKTTAARRAVFKFVSDQPGSRFQCKLDRKPFKPCRSPFKIKKLKPGRHSFQVRAINPQGIADPTPAVFRWKIGKG